MTIHGKKNGEMPPARLPRRQRRPIRGLAGFSLVEVEVALVLFGIALAGLAPYLVMYTKQLRNVQQRFSPQTTYYLVPAVDSWTRKLGAAAAVLSQDPGALPGQGAQAPMPNTVQITSLQKSLLSQEVTAFINVQASQQ